MKAFIGIVLFMGIVKLPELASYWEQSDLFSATYVQDRLSRQRFENILHHLHLTNNEDEESMDESLRKFQPMLNLINSVLGSAWKPFYHISIDEALIPFQGRVAFLQYAPDKPEKWGIKMWKLCDSTGFMYRCDIYTGASENKDSESSTVAKVVKSLVKPLSGPQPYHLYFDNLYTSVPLAHWLYDHSIYVTGTLRVDRKFIPKKFKDTKLENKGDSVWIQGSQQLVLCKWLDTKEVLFLSTAHKGEKISTVERSDGRGGKIKRKIPTIAADYNEHMGKVDLHNQSCSYYSYGRRCVKWWHAVFFYFVSVLVVNSWIAYKVLAKDDKFPLKDFQERIIRHLSLNYTNRKRYNVPIAPNYKQRARVLHPLTTKTNTQKEKCAVCNLGKPSKYCSNCHVFLHSECYIKHNK